jgi:hypothetical protein
MIVHSTRFTVRSISDFCLYNVGLYELGVADVLPPRKPT